MNNSIPPQLYRELILMTKLSELKQLEKSMKPRTELSDTFEMKDSEQHTRQMLIDITAVFLVAIAGGSALVYFAFWFIDGLKVSPIITFVQTFFGLGFFAMTVSIVYYSYVIRKNRRQIKAHFLTVVRRLRSITNYREQ